MVMPGIRKASMPTKCMLQMPTPSATDPPVSHAARARPRAWDTLPARSRAVYDANTAIRIETTTSMGWNSPTKHTLRFARARLYAGTMSNRVGTWQGLRDMLHLDEHARGWHCAAFRIIHTPHK